MLKKVNVKNSRGNWVEAYIPVISKEEEKIIKCLPNYLQKDIFAWVKGNEEKSSVLDCLYCELQASINSADWDREISTELANYLRREFLDMEV
jgi:hypothetical protein